MAGFIEDFGRDQTTLFPEWLDDWIGEDRLIAQLGASWRNRFAAVGTIRCLK